MPAQQCYLLGHSTESPTGANCSLVLHMPCVTEEQQFGDSDALPLNAVMHRGHAKEVWLGS